MTHFLKLQHFDTPTDSLQSAVANFLKELNNCKINDLAAFKASFTQAIESLNDVHFGCKSLTVKFESSIASLPGNEHELLCFDGYFVRFYIYKVEDWVVNYPELKVSAKGTLLLGDGENETTTYFNGLFH